jgi:anaerobic magnesium-protoporphyrin IX monomethyl ester cyclase
MMFHGTYTSEFYREIRNLLHDQVSLQAVHAAPNTDSRLDHGRAKRALDQRWHDLLIREVEYRSRPHQPAAIG